MMLEDAENAAKRKKMEEFLAENTVIEYDEAMVRRLIEKITVFDDRLVFEFKSGMQTVVEM